MMLFSICNGRSTPVRGLVENFNQELHTDPLFRAGAVKDSVLTTKTEVHRLKLFRLFCIILTNEKGGDLVGCRMEIRSRNYR